MRVLLFAGLLMVCGCVRSEAQSSAHDRAFWVSLRSAGFRLPQSEPTLPLTLEAASLLASTDPQLRDDIAYEAIETWVYREQRLDAAELNQLRTMLSANARHGLGEAPGDGLFLRSFSILALAVLAAEDLKRPFLDSRQFDELVDLGIEELGGERDLRGYVPGKGWGHATAHCARLAAPLTAIAGRSDADPAPFLTWLKRLTTEDAALWSGPLDPTRYVPVRAQLIPSRRLRQISMARAALKTAFEPRCARCAPRRSKIPGTSVERLGGHEAYEEISIGAAIGARTDAGTDTRARRLRHRADHPAWGGWHRT